MDKQRHNYLDASYVVLYGISSIETKRSYFTLYFIN